jgi:hypothetical protein
LSTSLDALRKAQDETRSGLESRIDRLPSGDGPGAPRRRGPRRWIVWVATLAAVLAVAFVGGLALGDRITALFGGQRDEVETAPATKQVATKQGASKQPATQPPAARAAAAAPRAAERAQAAKAAAPPSDRLAAAQKPAPPVAAPAAAPAAAPVAAPPAPPQVGAPGAEGRHVFGPVDGTSGSKGVTDEDRAAQLQQLRERMLKAREQARAAAAAGDKQPIPIVAPPSPQTQPAPRQPAVAVATRDQDAATPGAPLAQAAGSAGVVKQDQAPAPADRPAVAAPSQVAAPANAAPPVQVASARPAGATATRPPGEAAAVRDALAAVGAGPVGMPQPAARDGAGPASARDANAAPPAGDAKRQAENATTTVASLTPAAAPPGQPPVLRRSPGGAPQVAINILQWSSEPGRRFAFVSIDGGGLTQVHEGDHIGPLTIKHIHEQTIEFGYNDSSFLLRAN